MTNTAPDRPTEDTAPAPDETPMPAWGVGRVIVVWALAAVPMGVGAWVIAPALADAWGGEMALMRALIVCLTGALIWQGVVVAWFVRRERGSLAPRVLSEALWLRRPRSPRSGRTGGRVWWMLVPAAVILVVFQALPPLPHDDARDLSATLLSDEGAAFLDGAWGWFALMVVLLAFNTFLGEELLFRGLLLPRMEERFGRFAWVWNSVLFALYHLHQPWTMHTVLVSSTVFTYTTQRYRSAWFGIILHSLQSVVFIVLALGLVLGIA